MNISLPSVLAVRNVAMQPGVQSRIRAVTHFSHRRSRVTVTLQLCGLLLCLFAPASPLLAEGPTLYERWRPGADDFDTLTVTANILVDQSTPNGSYTIRREEMGNPGNYDNLDFSVNNGVATPSAFERGNYPIFNNPPHGQIRMLFWVMIAPTDQFSNVSAVSKYVDGGFEPDYYNHPNNPALHYTDSVTLDLRASPHTKPCDDRSGGNQDCSRCGGMARYSIHSMLASLTIQDTPLRYSPPRGLAIDFSVTYNQRESQQPTTFTYSNLGPNWTFNWLSYITDDPNTQLPSTYVHVPGGGAEIHRFDSGLGTFLPDPQSHSLLMRTPENTYEKTFADGSKQIFNLSNGTSYPRKLFMTQMIDPAGNIVRIEYDASFRIKKIKDALWQEGALDHETTVYYEGNDPLKITKVSDPYGRCALFEYYPNGKLKKITDEIGIESQFTYSPGTNSIDSLTTPYGTTTFQSGQNGTNRWIEITDPPPLLGKERVEYRDQAPGISASDPVAPSAAGITNAGLDVANTFYWDKKAMAVAPGDYTKAAIKHWLYNDNGSVSGIVSSEKKPLENRVWYTYAGQPDYQHAGPSANPSQVARVLADGATQLSQYEYNRTGKTTRATDPAGRVMSYIYDTLNQIDLLETRQTRGTNNELLRTLTYNSLHEPLTDTDASGKVTTYTYNPSGQMLTRKNARDETTTYAYGGGTVPAGYLASITSPPFNNVSAVTSFGYDGFKRIRTVTNEADQYTVTTDYDELDRKTRVTYPDNTFEDFKYTQDFGQGPMTKILDLTESRDRLGRSTVRHYNRNRQMDSITDPLGRITSYGWCTCGTLTSITDPKNQITTFNRDLQGRVYQKVFADTKTINYLFEGQTGPNTVGATSRLKSSTDALNRRTNYSYFVDDNISQVSYTDTSGNPLNPPTPTVSYTYDPNYNRITMMTTVGAGQTNYSYYSITSPPALGAGRLQTVYGSLANDTVVFTYDELGRTLGQSINGVTETVAYDSLGRPTTTDNALGHFSRAYDGVTPRLQTLNYPNGQSANYTYFGNNDDRRLQTLQNLASGAVNLSKFDYTYDDEGQITSWTSLLGATTSGRWFEHDAARQLLSARNASDPALTSQRIDYGYDVGANRTSDRTYNPQGSANNGTLNSYPAQDNALNQLDSFLTTINGASDNDATPLAHDLAGNLTNDGQTKTFEWDAANRLVAVNYTSSTNRSEFTYDGLSRRVKIVEKSGSTVTSTKKFVWIGNRLGQERDANNGITRRYFAEGEQRATPPTKGLQNYYYTRDHLGSIREMTNSTGVVQVRYDYDPYGKRTKLSGTLDVDFGYTGHYYHAPSGLNLSLYRAYTPALGRWLSRDPLEDAEFLEGPNLYAYVANNPVIWVDPTGQGIWKAIKCYRIIRKWDRECFTKLPDCRNPCGKTVDDRLEAILTCLKEHTDKSQRCYEGLNEELLKAGCAAVSVGAPPGYLKPPVVP